jgi:hypothetical protein
MHCYSALLALVNILFFCHISYSHNIDDYNPSSSEFGGQSTLIFDSFRNNTMIGARSIRKLSNISKSSQWGGWIAAIQPGYEEFDPFIFIVHHVHSFKAGEIAGIN